MDVVGSLISLIVGSDFVCICTLLAVPWNHAQSFKLKRSAWFQKIECAKTHIGYTYTQLSSTLQYVVKIDYLVNSAHYQRQIQHVTNMESLLRLRSYTTLLSSAVTLGHMSTAQGRCNIFFVSSMFLLCFPCFQLSFFSFSQSKILSIECCPRQHPSSDFWNHSSTVPVS